jgi:hypothetical protein
MEAPLLDQLNVIFVFTENDAPLAGLFNTGGWPGPESLQ